MLKKQCLHMATVMVFALLAAPGAVRAGQWAAAFPAQSVRIIVPFAKGGGLDVSVRLLAKYAELHLGQNILVENITKGGNIAGNVEGIGAPPDGYTLLAWGTGLVTDSLIIKNARYSHKDVKPLCMFADDPEVIVVNRGFAEKNGIAGLKDLLKYAEDNPGLVTMGMGGNWTSHDFLRLKMEKQAGIAFNRMPFLGGAPALKAMAEGNCNVALPFVAELMGLEDGGEVIPLAVAYDSRVPRLPSVPAVGEEGYPDMTQSVWRVLTVPAETPQRVADILEKSFRKAVAQPDYIAEARKLGINPSFKSGRGLEEFLDGEYEFYQAKTREWGIQARGGN